MMHQRASPSIPQMSDFSRRAQKNRGLDGPRRTFEALLRAILPGSLDLALSAVAKVIDPPVEDDYVVAAVAAGDLVRHPVDSFDAVVAVARVQRVETLVASHQVVVVAAEYPVVAVAAAQPVPAAVAVN